jgi:hypothetical protein
MPVFRLIKSLSHGKGDIPAAALYAPLPMQINAIEGGNPVE